jgi:predicted nucleic-acid-binding protein
LICLDTNVVVRLLVRDNPAQARRARALVERAIAAGDRLYVSDITVCELVWVLSVSYRFERIEVHDALHLLLGARELVFGSHDELREALARYGSGDADFADCLIAIKGHAAGCSSTATFDRALLREPGFVAP